MTQPRSKNFYRAVSTLFLGGAIASGAYSLGNLWDWHKFDKNVVKQVEIAANAPSAGKSGGSKLSMESAMQNAKSKVNVGSLENPAIIWKTASTDVRVLEDLLNKGIARSQQIESFKAGYDSETIPEGSPEWVQTAHSRLMAISTSDIPAAVKDTVRSEYGQRIAAEYESLNSVVGGGTRISAKKLQQSHRSLIDTLNNAGGIRSIVRFQADDYKEAHAHVFVGYLNANMGFIDESLDHFRTAKKYMDKYPDGKNLAFFRDTPELAQSTINGLIDSSIHELDALNKDSEKYSTGWWQRLRFFNQSIGGQSNPSIQDFSENVSGRYWSRFTWLGTLALAGLYLAGRNAKRLKLLDKYEVKHD
jgi:hypothetical protein